MSAKQLIFSLLLVFVINANLISQTAIKKNDKCSYKIFQNEDSTFGYDIFKAGKQIIHQPTIPGRSGSGGFKTKIDAAKIVKLVIKKIEKGEMPPTIKEEELKPLNI